MRDTVIDLVNGRVVGMPVLEIVPDVDTVGNKDAPTVGAERREGVTVTERLYVKDVVRDLVLVTDTVRVRDTVMDLVNGRVVGTPLTEPVLDRDVDTVRVTERVIEPLIDLVKGRVVGMPVTERVAHGEGDLVIVTERVKDTDTVGVGRLLDAAGVVERVMVTDRVREPVTV